jgi:hypothetical protein
MRCIVSFIILFVFVGGGLYAQVPPIFTPGSELHDVYGRACAHFYPQELPLGSSFRHDKAVCGTSAIVGLTSNWNWLPVAAKESFAFLLQRPTLTESILSPSGHFRIHFKRTGIHAVDPTDTDGNGRSDYVDEAARIFDALWVLQIDQLGYAAPPSDGDDIYDVYIKNLASQSAYGFTYPIAFPELTTPSYMEIDNNFTDNIYFTRGLDGLRVTAAHEFYHAVQFGYYADFAAAWWQELTATWMEDVAYPDVNDFYQYISCQSDFSCIYDDPEASLDKFSGSLHPFGGAIFAHHIEQVYDIDAIKNVWELLRERDPSTYNLSLISEGLPAGGLGNMLPRFSVWNYLTNTRTRSGYYSEAGDLPSIKHTDTGLVTGGSFSATRTLDHLGTTYIRVATANIAGGIRGSFTLDANGQWTLLVILMSSSRVELLWPRGTEVVIPNANRFEEIVFIVMETSLSGSDRRVDFTMSTGGSTPTDLVGDIDGDGNVAFPDFLSFANGFGLLYNHESYNPRLDLNGDGPIDFQDFLIFVSHFGESR